MISPSYILALSNRAFVSRQLQSLLCVGDCDRRRESFWNGWGADRCAGY